MNVNALVAGTVAALLAPLIPEAIATATAGQAAAAPSTADRFDPAVAVDEVRRRIREDYVLPERRPALDAVLAEGLRSGRYGVGEPSLFAERLNADLARVGQDGHLYFSYNPQRVAAFTARTADDRPDMAALEEQARRSNHGVRELRLLPGNVRYLNLSSFEWSGEESQAALSAAMAFLRGGDAVIIDVRRNGGGSGRAVHEIISHFVEAGRPLITFYRGTEASPTMTSLPGLSDMIGKPLYVLTSGGTGSAAEELVGHVAGYRLGEVVGAATSGGAFMNAVFPIDGRFELSVSVARPVLAATGRDWEGTGIAPTVPTAVETALETAHLHAVRRLAGSATQVSRRGQLEALAEGLEAVQRRGRTAARLADYTGTFGDRRVVLDGGSLWYHQDERPRRLMVPLRAHQFTLADDPGLRIEYQTAGRRVVALDVGQGGGPVQGRYERSD